MNLEAKGATMNHMLKASAALVAVAMFVSGCASGPRGSPGSGWGSEYVPIIDIQGVDQAKYGVDLAECRTYAHSIDAGSSAAGGAVASALFGAALAAALGGRKGDVLAVARGSALTGAAEGAGAAGATQKRLILNCLVGRGYRPLEVTLPMAYAPPPQQIAVATPPVQYAPPPQQPTTAASPTPATPQPTIATVAANASPPQQAIQATIVAGAGQVGQDSYNVERLPEIRACNPQARAGLAAKGAGFETYSVPCANGDLLMVRCEFGNCRVLK